MALLVVGVLEWQWYIDQIAVLFFGMGIVLGLAGGLGPSRIARTFVTGAKDMVGVVFIIACARALLVIAQEAKILDTILYAASNTLSVLPRGVIAQVMFLIQCVINFFLHSGTAQAALRCPSCRRSRTWSASRARPPCTPISSVSSSIRSCRPAR
jgi:uncharacterized ion transporter superfamily protein YfcC